MKTVLRKGGISLGLIALGLLLAGGTSLGSQKNPEEMPVAPDKIVSANTAFGFKVFREIAGDEPGDNILISPVGLGMVLAMAYDGASGETAHEMAKVLEVEGVDRDALNKAYASLMANLPAPGDDLSLKIANSLWADLKTPLKQTFLEGNRASYAARIENADLSAPETPGIINAWIEEQTGGKIHEVIDEIGRDVVLYLINTMYFSGRWTIPFDSTYTQDREFTLADGTTRAVTTMMTQVKEGHYYTGDAFKAARLDYGDGRVSMYLFLPDADTGLRGFYERLNPENWSRWLSGFETGPAHILLPRFSLEYDAKMNDVLKTLGMRKAFADADFGRMTNEHVFISMVKQKARLDVNEKGTEAASAALVEFKKGPAMDLVFTRPFFFAVVDNTTGAILFMGNVAQPN